MKLLLKQLDAEGKWIDKEVYFDAILKSNLDTAKKDLRDDWDQVWFVDGPEGAGKSVLAITCAYYTSPPERRHNLLDRIIVDIEDAPKVIKMAKHFDAVVIDEGYKGMSSTGAMSKLNKILQTMFTEIRAKNLFIFIVAPSFMDINRYFAIWRSRCLLHVYSDKGERGFCSFYNAEAKKRLFILGKKQFYNYNCVKPNFRFRFTKSSVEQCIDYPAYKQKKEDRNLTYDEDPNAVPPEAMRQAYILMRKNLPKIESKFSPADYATLVEHSERNIYRFDKIIKEKWGIEGDGGVLTPDG
jgi:hypothetical protein